MAETTAPLDRIDPVEAWQPWAPTTTDPFNLKWAGHLYRRAAFGASPTDLEIAVKNGLPATLDLLINGTPDADAVEQAILQAGAAIAGHNTGGPFASSNVNPYELRAWWLYAMMNGRRPVLEKMTLFWHNHFATSIAKVRHPEWMFNQNRLIRKHALGHFGPFLHEMSRDTAMLVWLDNNSNVKAHPNENYAREVMELFSLGVGHYTEHDIREGARAFTGWHTNGDDYDFNARFHDEGMKTVLGKTGPWNGDDVIDILLKRDDCADFLVRKLYRQFISEQQDPPAKLIAPLAESFRKTDYDIGDLVRRMLSSKLFFSAHAYRQKIKCPVEYVLGAVATVYEGEPAPQRLVGWIDVMGQQLFAPPNVKGWPGGQSWLNTSTVLARVNFAQALVMNGMSNLPAQGEGQFPQPTFAPPELPGQPNARMPEEPPPPNKEDVARLVREAKATKPDQVVRVLIDAFLPGGVGEAARSRLTAFIADGKPSGEKLDRRAREAAHAILSMPEYQLA